MLANHSFPVVGQQVENLYSHMLSQSPPPHFPCIAGNRRHIPAMQKASLLFGLLLTLLGVGAFVATGSSHFTSLIPAVIGVPILVCGLIVMAKPEARKHAMHVAALFGLLGTFGGLGMGLPKLGMLLEGTAQRSSFAISMQLAMGVLSLVFVVLCVKSFIDIRKSRLQDPTP